MDRAPRLILDSGAYSAFTRGGKPINLRSYMRFIRANHEHLEHYVNLDIIPGLPGSNRREWRAEVIDKASGRSYENYLRMRDGGLDPIPVFHQDEEFCWLDTYRDAGARYIALAPWEGGIHCGDWIDDCLTVLGDPTIKIHLLGTNSQVLLHHFSPTSADAGTWYRQSAAGQIPVPVLRVGKPVYSLPADIIAIGHRLRKNHYDLLDELDQERAHRYLEQECGVTLEQAQSDHCCRWRIWIKYFNKLAASSGTTIYFATIVDQNMIMALAQCAAKHHLLSYYELRRKPADVVEGYVRRYENSRAVEQDAAVAGDKALI